MRRRSSRGARPSKTVDVRGLSPATRVAAVYGASDADATRALYEDLGALGLPGVLAMNLLRAHKASARAKVYRGGDGGGSYRAQAYERKAWSLDQLCQALIGGAGTTGFVWGWKIDPKQEVHRWVLYVELSTGQVSFHSEVRGLGPDYLGDWDGAAGASEGRIIRWAASLLEAAGEIRRTIG